MSTTETLIEILSQTPTVLHHIIAEIPTDRLNTRRFKKHWSVTEWLCHLIDAQDVLINRFKQFEVEIDPLIADYEPPPQSDTRYHDRDFTNAMNQFTALRAKTISWLRTFDEAYWDRCGRHASFSPYGTRILLGHMVNVDYAHLFSIEKIGFGTVESFE